MTEPSAESPANVRRPSQFSATQMLLVSVLGLGVGGPAGSLLNSNGVENMIKASELRILDRIEVLANNATDHEARLRSLEHGASGGFSPHEQRLQILERQLGELKSSLKREPRRD